MTAETKTTLKASELRIGNFVKDKEGNILPVHGISEEERGIIWYGEEMGFYLELNEIEPIPLTPELLEKAGFEKLPHFTVGGHMNKGLGRGRFLSVSCVGTPNEMVFITEEDKPNVNAVIVARNLDYDGKTYLHQLQNLYFALTGNELEINL